MLNDKTKQQLQDLVYNEITGICRLYGVNTYVMNKKQIQMLVTIFQAGVGFLENIKQNEVTTGIREFNKTLQSHKTKGNKKDD